MAKVLRCKDVGPDCDFVARAETEEDVLKQAAAHAGAVHSEQRGVVSDAGERGRDVLGPVRDAPDLAGNEDLGHASPGTYSGRPHFASSAVRRRTTTCAAR